MSQYTKHSVDFEQLNY